MEINFARNRTQIAKNCPCGKSNKDGKFAPSKENPHKGYCHSCSKWFDAEDKEIQKIEIEKVIPVDYHPFSFIEKSEKNENNNFINFLKSVFDHNKVEKVARRYRVGSSKHWNGATVFWQIDNLNRVRYGKVMLYDQESGKRVKEPFNHFTNIHSILQQKDFNYKQCLFGLHLLPNNKKPIAIVESEKTAIIMSLVDTNYLWLATGGKGNFKYDILQPLAGKKVTAFPDVGETLWNEVSNRLNEAGFNITISDALENKEFPNGYDLADIVLQQLAEVSKKVVYPTCRKNPLSENQSVMDLHRIKEGMQINLAELSQLAKEMIPENDSRTQEELLISLNRIKGVSSTDGKDLLLIMQIKQIIEFSKAGYYFLADSSPF